MKNKASSLIYFIIILSILSVMLIGIESHNHSRLSILKIRKVTLDKKLLKKRIIRKEKKQISELLSTPNAHYDYLNFLTKQDVEVFGLKKFPTAYFNQAVYKDDEMHHIPYGLLKYITYDGDYYLDELVFSNEGTVSIGGYTVLLMTDKQNRNLMLPLDYNKTRGEIKVIYIKNILGMDIIAEEKTDFVYDGYGYSPRYISYKFLEDK